MIKFINDALKHRNGEKGFSLVELIVVVAILGILVVIAIPVFGAIQTTARQNTVATAAANGATSIAAQVTAGGKTATQALADLNNQSDIRYVLATAGTTDQTVAASGTTGVQANFATFTVPAAKKAQLAGATNDSTDTVYVYAQNKNNPTEWAGAGSAGPATFSWK